MLSLSSIAFAIVQLLTAQSSQPATSGGVQATSQPAGDNGQPNDDDAASSMPATALGSGPSSMPNSGPSSMPNSGPSSQPAEHAGSLAEDPAATDTGAAGKNDTENISAPEPNSSANTAQDFMHQLFGAPPSGSLTAGQLTGRPGFSESAATLPPGGMLLNLAVNLESDIDTGILLSATALDVPEALLRVGVFDYLELRIGGTWRLTALAQDEDFDDPPPVSAGVGRFTLGGTVRIISEQSYWPAVAAIITADLPLQNLRLGDFSAGGILAVQKSLLGRFQLAINVGAAWNGITERLSLPYRGLAALDIGLGLGAYIELFGDVFLADVGFDRLPSAWADGGLYFDLSPRVRIDALLGVNAFGSRGDWLAQIGLTWLITS